MHEIITNARQSKGFLSETGLATTVGKANTVLDGSVLISKRVSIGNENIFYPGVVIECQDGASIEIGDKNVFYPGTYILATAGRVAIGSGNQMGPAGLTIRANVPEAHIQIGDNGRYCDGVSIMGATTLGGGSQVLGNITVQNCSLAGGGNYLEPDPDQRAAVLKGFGVARGIELETGQVVNGAGMFVDAPVEWQRAYHPK